MNLIRRTILILLPFVALPGQVDVTAEEPAKPHNVLFIAVDDLRPALSCYGDPIAVTPAIDQLAERGLLFQNAYCQQAVCSPSRLSLMTGRRPDTIHVWDLVAHFRDTIPDVVTLPQHFKNHGYQTCSIGKIYHGGGRPAKDNPSWSMKPLYDVTRKATGRYALPKNLNGKGLKRSASEAADVSDSQYIDGVVCDAAVQRLQKLNDSEQPFFLAVGFRKPHLPFCAPAKYWDLYQRDRIPLPDPDTQPQNAPEPAVRSWRELEGYTDIPDDGMLTRDKVRELRHGYYACVSYIDAQVGRLLNELNRLQLTDNTVVLLWGDHGFHLGEQGLWTKANNYELATRVPLIVAVPQQTNAGAATDALVEFVDIYPSLADICGLPKPQGVEGISFRPLLAAPERNWKLAAFSQFPRAYEGHRHHGQGEIMGRAVRTRHHRYVEWRDCTSGELIARELYDHKRDPQETHNVAHQPSQMQTVNRLAALLSAGWKSALPGAEVSER